MSVLSCCPFLSEEGGYDCGECAVTEGGVVVLTEAEEEEADGKKYQQEQDDGPDEVEVGGVVECHDQSSVSFVMSMYFEPIEARVPSFFAG